ncbi:MAG: hypothetical protein ACQEQF_03115 [Bacillota bacterium]
MLKNLLLIIIADLNKHFKSRKFMIINILSALIPALIVILSLSYNKFNIDQFPLNGQLYTLSVLLVLSFINLKILYSRFNFSNGKVAQEWKKRLNCKYFTLYFALFLSLLIQNIILVISNLPLGFMVMALGGLSFSSLKKYYLVCYFIINLLGIIAIFLNEVFKNTGAMITIYIYLIFVSLIIFSPNRMESAIYIDLNFLPYLLILALIFFLLLIFPAFHKLINKNNGEV